MLLVGIFLVASVFQHAKAGMVAGVFTTIFMAPGERIKCLLQVIRVFAYFELEAISPQPAPYIVGKGRQNWMHYSMP